MYDFTLYADKDLFKIRDACVILARYGLENKELMVEAYVEINERRQAAPNPDFQPRQEGYVPDKI